MHPSERVSYRKRAHSNDEENRHVEVKMAKQNNCHYCMGGRRDDCPLKRAPLGTLPTGENRRKERHVSVFGCLGPGCNVTLCSSEKGRKRRCFELWHEGVK